jgi:hypothetical protein
MFGMIVCLLIGTAQAVSVGENDGSCAGAPPDAVMKLPPDLLALGATIHCTPFGHVIGARTGWIWTRPGTYSPVWIPAQMVREDPEPLGHQAHFTQIHTNPASVEEARKARTAFQKIFPEQEFDTPMLRLDVRGYGGKSLMLIFVNSDQSNWGIWCSKGECTSDSIFMMLDMSRHPADTPPR